ncbi:hypothetical protein M378DRAFT_749827 [Amanita muscaria Koide BX008]|uniref:Uncharacterized protein n=1 Tax=Amanita muscaria (strain Koide BX008) TaxID=946122 RepID=A0A0C2X0U5_AMAMK|nr:hypothetical protein M378DRAFT_749827 [Amanita muscaria Koide BX008]
MYSPSSTSSARFETGHLRPGYLQDGLHQTSNLTIQLQFGVKVGANSLKSGTSSPARRRSEIRQPRPVDHHQ